MCQQAEPILLYNHGSVIIQAFKLMKIIIYLWKTQQ